MSSAQQGKRIAKAVERQARKLRLKGIKVDMQQLRADYLAVHKEDAHYLQREQELQQRQQDDADEELPIDVVGGVCSDSMDNSHSLSSTFAALTPQSPKEVKDDSHDGHVGSAVIKLEPMEPLELPQPPSRVPHKPQYNSSFSIESLLGT